MLRFRALRLGAALLPALFWALVSGTAGLGESLWLDELHSAWTVKPAQFPDSSAGQGSMQLTLSARAAAGNQLPTYFGLLRAVDRTLSGTLSPESILRLPSLAAWFLAIVCLAFILRRIPDWAPIVAATLFVALDRIALFYATEARPYFAVALVNLVGWWALAAWIKWLDSAKRGSQPAAGNITEGAVADRMRSQSAVLWTATAVLSCWLHPVAVLSVACQFAWATGRVLMSLGHVPRARSLRAGLNLLLVLVVTACCLSPIVWFMQSVWEHRSRWNAFASGTSLVSSVSVFALMPLLFTLPVCILLDVVLGRSKCTIEDDPLADRCVCNTSQIDGGMWMAACFGPWIIAWVLTIAGIAPLMHRRYLITCMLPLAILIALGVAKIGRRSIRRVALVAVIVGLTFYQGSVDLWQSGQVIGVQRGEGWREAADYLSEQMRAQSPSPDGRPVTIWCAAGLIEAADAPWPPSDELIEYLTFPLRGPYRPDGADKLSETEGANSFRLRPLLQNSMAWADEFQSAVTDGVHSGWVVYRGTERGLKVRLHEASKEREELRTIELLDCRSFGRVVVAKWHRPREDG